jgi:pentapeptide MXKDX repeat protein
MRKVWLGIVGAVVCLGLGLAVVGYDALTANKDNMSGDKMQGDRMQGDKMQGDKMSGEAKDKM